MPRPVTLNQIATRAPLAELVALAQRYQRGSMRGRPVAEVSAMAVLMYARLFGHDVVEYDGQLITMSDDHLLENDDGASLL
jgi:hypothetical protein